MVRIIGNTPERVVINDLGDVVYYRQQKQYTDEEYRSSKDLQRRVRSGALVVLDRKDRVRPEVGLSPSLEGSPPRSMPVGDLRKMLEALVPALQVEAVKEAIREVLPTGNSLDVVALVREAVREALADRANSDSAKDVREALQEMMPLLLDTIRQAAPVGEAASSAPLMGSEFVGPEYIPDISTDDLHSSIQIKERKAEATDVSSALEALKRLQKRSK